MNVKKLKEIFALAIYAIAFSSSAKADDQSANSKAISEDVIIQEAIAAEQSGAITPEEAEEVILSRLSNLGEIESLKVSPQKRESLKKNLAARSAGDVTGK